MEEGGCEPGAAKPKAQSLRAPVLEGGACPCFWPPSLSTPAAASVSANCASEGQVQCFGWRQGIRGTEWGQVLLGGKRTPPPPIGAELGGVPSPLLQQPARVPGKEAGDTSRRNHPFSLAMATFVGLQPQPGLRLSPATRRLGDLHKPQASALPPASQEGCSIRGAPRVSLALSVSKPLAPALSHSPEISRDGVALGGRRTNLHSLSDGGRGRAPSVPRTNGWKSGACHWLELSK